MATPAEQPLLWLSLLCGGLASAVGCGRCDEPVKPGRRDPAEVADQLLADGQAASTAVPSAERAEGCGTLYEAITSMRAKVGAGPLVTEREVFVASCRGLDPAVRRCLDPAVAAREAASCSARVEALPPSERDRVKGLMRGAEPPPGAP